MLHMAMLSFMRTVHAQQMCSCRSLLKLPVVMRRRSRERLLQWQLGGSSLP